jgi:hypothetical protein
VIATSLVGVGVAAIGARFQRLTSGWSRRRRSDCVWPLCLPVAGVSCAFSLLGDRHPAAGVIAAAVDARFQRLTSGGSRRRTSDCVWPLCLPVAGAGSLLVGCHVSGWCRCCWCWRPTQESSKA